MIQNGTLLIGMVTKGYKEQNGTLIQESTLLITVQCRTVDYHNDTVS